MRFGKRRSSPPPLRIDPLSDAEVEWCADQVQVARILAQRYVAEAAGAVDAGAGDGGVDLPSLEVLDQVVDGWLDDDETRLDINLVVNGVGIALGHHLAAATDLSWVIATDDQGSDLALHGQPGDVAIYPANATAKRLVAGQRSFVRPLHDQLAAGALAVLRGGGSPTDR